MLQPFDQMIQLQLIYCPARSERIWNVSAHTRATWLRLRDQRWCAPTIDGVGNHPSVRTQLDSPNDSGGELDTRHEVSRELVIAFCDAPPILEPAEHAFHQVSPFVDASVEGMDACARGVVRNNRDGSARAEELAQPDRRCRPHRTAMAVTPSARGNAHRPGLASHRARWFVRGCRRPRGFSCFCPHRTARSPASPPPYSTGRRAMGLGGGRIDGVIVVVRGDRPQILEQIAPVLAPRPAVPRANSAAARALLIFSIPGREKFAFSVASRVPFPSGARLSVGGWDSVVMSAPIT